MRRPRVCFLLPDFHGGGAERAVLDVLSRWQGAWPAPHVIVRSSGGSLAPLFWSTTAEIHVVGTGGRKPSALGRLREAAKAAVVADTVHADVLVSLLTPFWVVGARTIMRSRAAVVTSVQNPPGRTLGTGRVLYRRGISAVLKRADVVVPIAPGIARELVAMGVSQSRVQVVPNGVDLGRFELAKETKDRSRTVLVAARLHPQKRVDLALRAFAAADKPAGARLQIAGEGPEEARLINLASQLGISDVVEFLGFVEDLPNQMASVDGLLLTSDYEGFGNVLVEALAVGLPIVATDAPYGPRFILEGGRFGDLVPTGDVPAISRGLERLWAERGRGTRDERRSRAEAFSAEKQAARWHSVLAEAMGE